jgi:hypothetical protein
MNFDEAKELYDSGRLEKLPDAQIVGIQLWQERLVVNAGIFHLALERVLGRPVPTSEFAFPDALRQEALAKGVRQIDLAELNAGT